MLVSRVKLSAETESLSRTPYTADNLFLFPLDVNNNGNKFPCIILYTSQKCLASSCAFFRFISAILTSDFLYNIINEILVLLVLYCKKIRRY